MFDTQVAAMALGLGEQVGYSSLVESYLGHQVDKGARFTDWSRRPLETRQLDYAISDVTHLATLFPKMLNRLKKTGRGAWLDERSEEHTSDLQSLMRISYAVFCLKKKLIYCFHNSVCSIF